MSLDDLRAIEIKLPVESHVTELMVAFPGHTRTSTSTAVVAPGSSLESTIETWQAFLRRSLEENISGHPSSLSAELQTTLLSGLSEADANEVLLNSAQYVQDARAWLTQLNDGSFTITAFAARPGSGEVDELLEYLREEGLGITFASRLSSIPILPPVDPSRDRNPVQLPDDQNVPPQASAGGGPSSLLGSYSYEEHISRRGVMTWTPISADPDYWYVSGGDYRVLEVDLLFGSSFRVSGHDGLFCAFGDCVYGSYEWDFDMTDDWGHGYDQFFYCDLPSPCTTEVLIGEGGLDWTNYGAITGSAAQIAANTYYHVDIGTVPGSVSYPVQVQLRSVAGAISTECPYWSNGLPDPALCGFENYGHLYDKLREHPITSSSGNYYSTYSGGSYVTDNTFSPCPGSWGFSAGNVDYWCWSDSNGPEPPGRVTIRPKSGYSTGFAYRTVPFSIVAGDNFSVEYVVQCLTGNPCQGRLGWQGRDGGYPVGTHLGATFNVPNDGWYYLCRYDSHHGATGGSLYPHANLRTLLYNDEGGTQLRIDSMAIYGWVGYHDGFESGIDNNTCNAVAQG
jgi:hypothetical protein